MKPKSKLILHARTPPVVRRQAMVVGRGSTVVRRLRAAVGRQPNVVDCG